MLIHQVEKALQIKKGRILYMLKTTKQIKGKQKDGTWDVDSKSVAEYRKVQLARKKGFKAQAKTTKVKTSKRPIPVEDDGDED